MCARGFEVLGRRVWNSVMRLLVPGTRAALTTNIKSRRCLRLLSYVYVYVLVLSCGYVHAGRKPVYVRRKHAFTSGAMAAALLYGSGDSL